MCVELSSASIFAIYRQKVGLSFVEWSLYLVEQVHSVQDGSSISHLYRKFESESASQRASG